MDKFLIYAAFGVGLAFLSSGQVRVARQTNTNAISGANVTHSTEYDEGSKTLRFRIQVDYGKQPWDAGQRTFPTPDGRVLTLSWTGSTRGFRIQLDQQIANISSSSSTYKDPDDNSTISGYLEVLLGSQLWDNGMYVFPTSADQAYYITWRVTSNGLYLEIVKGPYFMGHGAGVRPRR